MRFALAIALAAALMTVSSGHTDTAQPIGAWRRNADLPLARASAAGGWIDGRFVVAGGSYWRDGQKFWSGRVDLLDPAGDRWEAGPNLPEAVAGAGSCSDGSHLYVVGGEAEGTASSRVWRLARDGERWQWTSLPDLPRPRAFGAVTVHDGKLYLVGGCDDAKDLRQVTREVLRLDLRRRSQGWRVMESLPGRGRCSAAVVADGRAILVFGGCFGNPEGKAVNLDAAAYYEPGVDHWSTLGPMPYAVRGHNALSLGNGRIGIFGGYSGDTNDLEQYGAGYGFERRVQLYEPDRNRYSPAAALPGAVAAASADIRDGRIELIGGEDLARSRTDRHYSTTAADLLKDETSRPVFVCLGDSVTHGVGRSGVKEAETYPRVLETLLKEKLPSNWVVNAGLGGENTRQALQRFGNVVRPLHRVDALVIMYGLNDAALVDVTSPDRKETRVPVEEYRANLTALVREAKRQGAQVVLCTPNPMTPAYSLAKRGAYGAAGDVNFALKAYVAAAREVARAERVDLVDVYDLFSARPGWETLFPDGIHSNATGLDLIARAVRTTLMR